MKPSHLEALSKGVPATKPSRNPKQIAHKMRRNLIKEKKNNPEFVIAACIKQRLSHRCSHNTPFQYVKVPRLEGQALSLEQDLPAAGTARTKQGLQGQEANAAPLPNAAKSKAFHGSRKNTVYNWLQSHAWVSNAFGGCEMSPVAWDAGNGTRQPPAPPRLLQGIGSISWGSSLSAPWVGTELFIQT